MPQLLQYARIEVKKAFVCVRRMFLSVLFLGSLALAAAAGAGLLLYHTGVLEPVVVALSVPEGEKELLLAARLVSSRDSLREVASLTFLSDAEEAKRGVETGGYQAAIILPERFYQDLFNGTNTPATVLLPENSVFLTGIFREVLEDGVSLIDTGEAAIYAATDMWLAYGGRMSRREMEVSLTELFMKGALSRGRLFYPHELSVFNDVVSAKSNAVAEYYASVFFTVLPLLLGMGFGFLYTKEEKSVERRLGLYGVSTAQTGAVKLLVMLVVMWVFALFFMLVYAAAGGIAALRLPRASALAPFALLLPLLAMAAFFHLFYTWGGGGGGGSALTLFSGSIFLLLGGCIVPVAFLPEAVQKVARLLPVGFWRSYTAHALYGGLTVADVLVQLLLLALFFGLALLIGKRTEKHS